MRISFDIDDTLTCGDRAFPQERNSTPLLLRHWFQEPLRLGTKALFKELQDRDWETFIYTTSARSHSYIKLWFCGYGIKLNGIINGATSAKVINNIFSQSQTRKPSKYPPAFNLDLHIDDSQGVGIEGKRYGFEVLIIDSKDPLWTEKVLETVSALENPQ